MSTETSKAEELAQHSPLPWEFDNRISRLSIIAADGELVAERVPTDVRDLANFRLIVRAVNPHDALFAAAKEVMELSIHIDAPRLRAAFIHLQAAIAAAEELEQ